ncbi:MAG: FAD-dependent oxidoreductase [Nitrospiraceae bacterium]|nr:FAD-dependent oxidoreductase [Nitrospiraceae bacterium]
MEIEGKFCRIGLIARNTLMFQVEIPKEAWASFVPGQYAYLEWINPPFTDEKGDGRNFSIVSTTSDLPILSFATRLTGSAFKKCLENLPDGSPIWVSGPFGRFCLPACLDSRSLPGERPIVFVAGGIGVTPFRSMLIESVGKFESTSFFLFTANNDIEDSVFREEFEGLARDHKNLSLHQFVSHSSMALPPGVEVRPLAASSLFESLGEKFKKGDFYIAGPPSMVASFKNALFEFGILEKQVHTDLFLGYF